MPNSVIKQWIVCQIGAREHYAVPRALHRAGRLAALITDFWCPPGSLLGKIVPNQAMRDRWHPDLSNARVIAPNLRMLAFEAWARFRKLRGWPLIVARNEFFQSRAIQLMRSLINDYSNNANIFSYSYACNNIFQFAKGQGWTRILGQIDPGPEEECIVAAEHLRYPDLGSRWQPAPPEYWNRWRDEVQLSDIIVINSDWSRECLQRQRVEAKKMREIPLVVERGRENVESNPATTFSDTKSATEVSRSDKFQVLFLGQVNLRKGVGRLLDAMRMLKNEPIELTLAGPSELDPGTWSDLPNVNWIGPIPRSDVGRIYQQSNLFILPTLSDGYAITQLEALTYNLPVMRSNRCGNPFLPGSTELLLEDLEPATICESLLRACREREHPFQATPKSFSLADLARRLDDAVLKPTL